MLKRALIGCFFCLCGSPALAQLGDTEAGQDLPIILRDLATALENADRGTVARWHNALSGNQGTITPLWTFVSKDGLPCRHYRRTWVSPTRAVEYEGAACRQGPRDWLIRQEGVVADKATGLMPAHASTAWAPPDLQFENSGAAGLEVAARSIAIAQRDLRDLGYDPGPIDGVFGARTRDAIRAFQSDRSMPVTGEIDAALAQRIMAAAAAVRSGPAQSTAPAWQEPQPVGNEGAAAGEVRTDSVGMKDPAPEEEPVIAVPSAPKEPPAVQQVAARPASTELMKQAQQDLEVLGYGPGRTDGVSGPLTVGAVMRFQRVHGLEMTGTVDEDLVDRLRSAVAAQQVEAPPRPALSERDVVQEIQSRLAALGYEPGPVDGIPGERTRAAAAAYQMDRGRTPVERLDRTLLAALDRDYAILHGGAMTDVGTDPPEPVVTTFEDYFDRSSDAPPLAEKVPDLILDATRQGN